ncbi:MAG: DEAD/DEAH box helicase, partial [Synechocystis sp.]|nr:DEAD/DEAH box helicase [Synechocystis sp.]
MGNNSQANTLSAFSVEAQYAALPPLGKEIIRFLAIAYAPVTQTFLVDCLREISSDLKLPLHPPLDTQFKAMLSQLREADLVKKAKQGRLVCHESLRDIPCREAVKSGRYGQLADLVNKHEPIRTVGYSDRRNFYSEDQFIREVRIGIYRQDWDFIDQQFQDYYYFSSKPRLSFPALLVKTINNPFDSEWLSRLDPELLSLALVELMDQSLERLSPADETFEVLKEFVLEKLASPISEATQVAIITAQEQFFCRGELNDLKQLNAHLENTFKDLHPCYSFIAQANLSVLQGQYAEAIAAYETALKGIRRLMGKRKAYFLDLTGVLCLLALIGEGSTASLTKAQELLKIALKGDYYLGVYNLFDSLVDWLNGDRNARTYLESHCGLSPGDGSIESFLKLLLHHWLQKDGSSHWLDEAKSFYQDAFRADYQWLAMNIADLIGRYESNEQEVYATLAAEWQEKTGIASILDVIQPKSEWELSLHALANLTSPTTATKSHAAVTGANKRLAWFVTYYGPENVHLSPKEQSLSKKGEWTAGRAIAMKRLSRRSDIDYLSPQDERVCGHIETYSYGYYGQVDYQFNDMALGELIGHPLVFWDDNPNIPIEIVTGEPQLQVKKTGNKKLVIKLEPPISDDSKVIAIKESLTRLKVIAVTPEHRRIATILGNKNRLEVPSAAQEQVMTAINAVASLVTVHSDIGGGLENVESLPAHSLPHFHLLPLEGGLRVALLTRPFGDSGPYFQPGKGGETVITEIDGKRYQTSRDLKDEKQQAQSVIKACPTLFINDSDGGEWYLEDPENCLELLLELQELGDQARVEWPEGEKMRVSHPAGFGQFKLNIKRQRDWFAAEGELQIDDNLVMGLQQLMELLENSPGRFVPLADGQFLALTNEFRQRLEELKAYSEKYGDGRRFHPLAALALEDFLDEAEQVKADRHWKEHLKKIKEMKDLDPQLPSTLQADLRDYQREGFQWLARLAHWGVGACLADDMGLGKTLQALALILTKAAAGPTLIVAP